MIPTLADVAGVPETEFQSAPNNVDLKQFGDKLAQLEQDVLKNMSAEFLNNLNQVFGTEYQEYSVRQLGSALLDGSVQLRYNLGTATIYNDGPTIIEAEDSGTHTLFRVTKRTKLTVTARAGLNADWHNHLIIKTSDSRNFNGNAQASDSGDNDVHLNDVGYSFILNKDEYFYLECSQSSITASTELITQIVAEANKLD
jgi:hypothetical protein